MAKEISENKLNQLLELNKKLVSQEENPKRLKLLSDAIKSMLNVDRCTVFMHDDTNGSFWSVCLDGLSFLEVPDDTGIVGEVFKTKNTIMINNAKNSKLFNDVIDTSIGYDTRNILTMPIFGYDKKTIGVIQLLNKTDGSEGFSEEDEKVLNYVMSHISAYLEAML
ncbi:GAF domain-containing protein [Sulfurospirillum sp. 1612]|uniref:GAF domain-containing protein n=1 Tax=Sulfurospirillum sp. 1612 TaxID=3094835 RepID=UPI002F9512BA